MMNDGLFLALDLAGSVHHLALCETSPGAAADSPAWLIRSRMRRMYSWLAGVEPDREPVPDPARVFAVLERWDVCPERTPLVLLTGTAASSEPFAFAERGGCPALFFPRGHHAISPRGIAAAHDVKDYVHRYGEPARPAMEAIRDAFVPLMERAADDVQGDGLEQDDSFLDRFAQIRVRGCQTSLIVPVETISDPQWLIESWQKASAEQGDHVVSFETVEILALLLRCVVEPAVTSISAVAPTDGQVERARVADAGGPTYSRAKLMAGDGGEGPAVVVDEHAPIQVPPGWSWELNRAGHLLCRRLDS